MMKKLLVQLIKGCRTRHKKLEEECCQTSECVLEGVTFYVAYLGSCIVAKPSGEETTSQAVNTIVAMAKKLDKKLERVALTISLQGIRMVNCATGDTHLEFSIYRISYCSADATYDHVFNFIATNSNNTMECHAFLCKKRKMAQSATLTIAQAFNLAYSYWLAANERRRRREKERRSRLECSCDRRKVKTEVPNNTAITKFEPDLVPDSTKSKTETTSESDSSQDSSGSNQHQEADSNKTETLLIDLRSPGDNDNSTKWSEISIVDTDQSDNNDEKLRDLSFTDIALRKSAVPILNHLPENASSLQIDSFIPPDLTKPNVKLAGPSTPLHGSSLTYSTLCTPVGSPTTRVLGHHQNSLTPTPAMRFSGNRPQRLNYSPLLLRRPVSMNNQTLSPYLSRKSQQ